MIEALADLALEAGAAIMTVYRDMKPEDATIKGDGSPVTKADALAESIILEGLSRIAPQVPVVAEESVAAGRVPETEGRAFFLVDPLDGTKEFLSRNGDFTVNIALVEHGVPVLGVVENMAYMVAPDGSEMEIFGRGGAVRMAEALNVPFLGEVPLDPAMRKGCDEGRPVTALESDGEMAARFKIMAERIMTRLAT